MTSSSKGPGLILDNCEIEAFNVGVQVNVPLTMTNSTISKARVAVHLTSEAAEASVISSSKFLEVTNGIVTGEFSKVPEFDYIRGMPQSELQKAIAEISAVGREGAAEAAVSGRIGQYLRRQNLSDWAAVAQTIGIALGAAL